MSIILCPIKYSLRRAVEDRGGAEPAGVHGPLHYPVLDESEYTAYIQYIYLVHLCIYACNFYSYLQFCGSVLRSCDYFYSSYISIRSDQDDQNANITKMVNKECTAPYILRYTVT